MVTGVGCSVEFSLLGREGVEGREDERLHGSLDST